MASDYQTTRFSSQPDAKYIAKVEGGSLIQILPSSIEEATRGFSSVQKLAYQRAFEADMINSLVGPLAEAKHIALRDGEAIYPRLVHLNALHNYGGTSDLERVNEYLECFIANEELREQKITELFLTAFNFIDNSPNWRAINALADYIVDEDKSVIECHEIIAVLKTAGQVSATAT